jgi:hypothetical protein
VDGEAGRGGNNELTGLKALPQREFDKRTPPEQDGGTNAASLQNAGDDGDIYAAYAPFGLVYDAEDKALAYNGKRVRYFSDKYVPEGKIFTYGEISNWDEDGVIDVLAVRGDDEGKGFGDTATGRLTGLRVATAGEFQENTLLWDNVDPGKVEEAASKNEAEAPPSAKPSAKAKLQAKPSAPQAAPSAPIEQAAPAPSAVDIAYAPQPEPAGLTATEAEPVPAPSAALDDPLPVLEAPVPAPSEAV